MPLKKAMIYVQRGTKKNKTDKIEVMFNPNQYTVDLQNTYTFQSSPGISVPIAQFSSGGAETLDVELFFDTYEKRTDVRKYTKKITSLMNVEKDLHTPPLCRFVWGSLDFQGVMMSVNQSFTMFLDSGIPVRATLKVKFKQSASVEEQLKDTPRQSADRTKRRTLHQGEELWMIADDEYDDPGKWREIAEANQIDNPRSVKPGTELTVPRLE
ncbi:CIS tube protein [Marinicrinis sediminis]|uniref:Peptidoglycan-binding protein n=1 Tax=Marinicrinis sediminis TaxID=1652465 RepID=A0ABW5RE14_9BACL